MEKRGFLLAEETLKIILAVIVLIILVGLLAKLYYGNKNNQELLQAEATLNRLNQEIESLSVGVPKTFEIQNPVRSGVTKGGDHWVIYSWYKEDVYPKKCLNMGWDNCLCICKNSFIILGNPIDILRGLKQRFANKCDKVGVCFESEVIVVQEGWNFNLNRIFDSGVYYGFIPLTGDPPIKINLQKEESQVKIDKI